MAGCHRTVRHDPPGVPAVAAGIPRYHPAMRRWFCIIALLAGFSRSEYAWTIRPRLPIPIERPIDPDTLDPLEAAARLRSPAGPWVHP
jgi:hypothetical protein